MAKLVLSVGFLFPGGFTEFVSLNSRRSLLDADVIIFRPSIGLFNRVESQFQGKPSLYDSASFELKNAASHWRQQIQMALNAGKNVFVLFPKLEEVWVDSGVKHILALDEMHVPHATSSRSIIIKCFQPSLSAYSKAREPR